MHPMFIHLDHSEILQRFLHKTITIFSIALLIVCRSNAIAQTYPSYGSEIQVTINGLSFDAMEPFISSDGNYIFFNNLNDGINTKLFYATKVNDSTFNYVGELNGTNQTTPPHLDAVPDMDTLNNFYWTSTRAYPTDFDNLFHGKFDGGNVSNTGRVHGDFYIYSPGWLIMDHGISFDGQLLYFNNARFDGICQGPCETKLGLAQKENDSTFMKLPDSDEIMQTINDANYIYYAPCISIDNLELYYTRYLKGAISSSTLFEVCVAVRNASTDAFSDPHVLFSELIANIVEAPTVTKDKHILYYHKKIGGTHKIMMRYRYFITGFTEINKNVPTVSIIPNPMSNKTIIKFEPLLKEPYSLFLLDDNGRTVKTYNNVSGSQVDIYKDNLKAGIYIIQIIGESKIIATGKLLVE